jgi:chorismate mutase
MGARRELVTGIFVGVVVGVAITVAVFQLRGQANISAAPKTTDATSEQLAQLRREREELVKRLAEAKRAGAGLIDHGGSYRPSEPDADHGMSTSDDWWNKLPPNPSWDAPRKQLVLDRLAKLGVKLDAKQVECKRRCCRIAIDDETYDEHFRDIGTLGLDFEPPDGSGIANAGSTYMITKCWRASDEPAPDRLTERDALLAKVKPELERCAQSTSPTITLKLSLFIDTDGQIAKVDSNAKQLGQKAASCAETAVLQAAAFAPSPRNTEVPLTIVLGK